MNGFIGFVIILIIGWILWASLSTSGLYELNQINPEYVSSDRSLAYLVSKWNYSLRNGFWDHYHVENCSLYMPDWINAEACVNARIFCESKAPLKTDASGTHADIFSKEFKSCFSEKRPTFGIIEWIRLSRSIYRIAIVSSAYWITGGFKNIDDSHKTDEWEKNNNWWAKPLLEWEKETE